MKSLQTAAKNTFIEKIQAFSLRRVFDEEINLENLIN